MRTDLRETTFPGRLGPALPCSGQGAGFTKVARASPCPGVRRSPSEPLCPGCSGGIETHQLHGLACSSMRLQRELADSGVRRKQVHTAMLWGLSILSRSTAGTAEPHGSALHCPNPCLWERQDGPEALEKRAPRPPNFEPQHCLTPTSNSGKKPNHKKKRRGIRNLPSVHPGSSPLPSPNEIITS